VLEATIPSGGGQSAVHKRRLNDKYEDDLAVLTYYGARYYDKVLAGWTQADPLYLRAPDLASLSTARRAQTFVFSLNNPNRYIDPDGLDSEPGLNSCTPHQGGFRAAMDKHAGGPIRGTVEAASDQIIRAGNDYIAAAEKERLEQSVANSQRNRYSLVEYFVAQVASRVLSVVGRFFIALDDGGQMRPATAPDGPSDPEDLLVRGKGSGSTKGAAKAPAVIRAPASGSGPTVGFGVVSIGPSGVRVAASERGVGGIAHNELAKNSLGPLAVGERRYGYMESNGQALFGMQSAVHRNGVIAADLPSLTAAIKAAGFSSGAAVVGGAWKDLK
jgi:RHS repeat-associated protein